MWRRQNAFGVLDRGERRDHARQQWRRRVRDPRRWAKLRRDQIAVCLSPVANEKNVIGRDRRTGIGDPSEFRQKIVGLCDHRLAG
jgi:hypothetical protein